MSQKIIQLWSFKPMSKLAFRTLYGEGGQPLVLVYLRIKYNHVLNMRECEAKRQPVLEWLQRECKRDCLILWMILNNIILHIMIAWLLHFRNQSFLKLCSTTLKRDMNSLNCLIVLEAAISLANLNFLMPDVVMKIFSKEFMEKYIYKDNEYIIFLHSSMSYFLGLIQS